MAGNPLVSAQPEPTPPPKRPDRLVSLISNAPANQIKGLDDFLSVFNQGDVGAEIEPFRFVVSRKARRSIGGKFGAGLTSEVTENIVINPNEDLFGLRRWLGTIRSRPASVLLLNINKIKDEALAAPLIFSIMFKTGRPILVTGVDESSQDQLFTEPDLTLKKTPGIIQRNPELMGQILSRVQRKKGFINTIRNLLDYDFFSDEVRDKFVKINAGGDPGDLSKEEIVNISIISDLVSRYQYVLEQVTHGYQTGSVQMTQLVPMFELLLSDLPMPQAVDAFKAYLGEDGEQAMKARTITTRQALFGYIHKHLSQRDGTSRGADKDPKAEFGKTLSSVVIRHRLRVDPFLWKRCAFLNNRTPSEHAIAASLQPLHGALTNALEAKPDKPSNETKAILGRETFDLFRVAATPADALKTDDQVLRKQAATRLLGHLEITGFNPADVISNPGKYKELLAGPEAFADFYIKQDIATKDIRHVVAALEVAISYNEAIADQVRKSTLDVINSHAKDRERALRKIYIVKALPELTNFSFFLGDKGLASVERLCGMSILRSRFGLDVHSKPIEADSMGLFTEPSDKPLGILENDPELLSHAYSEMMALQVETHAKRAIDKKINYLQSTYGDNFFEVIFNGVVTNNDLPLSSNQFASIIRERGVLGNLDARGWKSDDDEQLLDPFITFTKIDAKKTGNEEENKAIANFETSFKQISTTFRKMLNELKAHSEGDTDESDMKPVIWGLFKRGIYNLASEEAREDFKKTKNYTALKDLIATVSSANYSIFAKETDEGVTLFLPRKYHALTLIGNRFAFLVENKVVRYQLLITPAQKADQLDPTSRVFFEALEIIFNDVSAAPEFKSLVQSTEDIRRAEAQWRTYSQHLAFAMLDRILGETVIKELIPGKIRTENLFYLPDSKKLCLGPSAVAGHTLPFSKILQNPENNGNIQKNNRSSSTTIDDFAIEVHKIGLVREELENIRGICIDVLDILQNLSHAKGESAAVLKYEHNLQVMIKLLSKPIRQIGEPEIQALHKSAKEIQDLLRSMYSGSQSNNVVSMLQRDLQTRRSDGHNLKLNYSDSFIIDKTEIKVMQKVKSKDGEVTRRQKKIEVEVDSSHQTIALRIREIINTQKILQSKFHVIFSPEGQKKKQVDYILDIIETLQALRGKSVTFYVDNAMLAESQEHALAARVKPHNFFDMGMLKSEISEDMNVTATVDPLSGRTKVVQSAPKGGKAPPPDGAKESFFRASADAGIEYRLDHGTSKYFFKDGSEWIPSRALPVDLGTGAASAILMTKNASGKLQFHGLLGSEVLLPNSEPVTPPTLASFKFLDKTVNVLNEGGKAVVKVDKASSDDFLDELRSV